MFTRLVLVVSCVLVACEAFTFPLNVFRKMPVTTSSSGVNPLQVSFDTPISTEIEEEQFVLDIPSYLLFDGNGGQTVFEKLEAYTKKGYKFDMRPYDRIIFVASVGSDAELATKLFDHMERNGLQVPITYYNLIIRACHRERKYNEMIKFLERATSKSVGWNVFTYQCAVIAYAATGQRETALTYLGELKGYKSSGIPFIQVEDSERAQYEQLLSYFIDLHEKLLSGQRVKLSELPPKCIAMYPSGVEAAEPKTPYPEYAPKIQVDTDTFTRLGKDMKEIVSVMGGEGRDGVNVVVPHDRSEFPLDIMRSPYDFYHDMTVEFAEKLWRSE